MKSIIFRKESFRAQDGGKSTMKLFIDQVTSIYNSIDVTSYDSNKEDISCRSTGIISRIINWAFVNHYQSVINHNAIEAEEALYTIEYTDGNLPKNTSADLNQIGRSSCRERVSSHV